MNRYLTKLAEAKSKPAPAQEHHDEVLEKLEASGGVIAHHSMGSGKTLLALRAAERAQQAHPDKAVIIASTSSAIGQFPGEAKKFGIKLDKDRLHYISHQIMARKADELASIPTSLLVIDEVHKIRNPKSLGHAAAKTIADNAEQNLAMSGSVMFNKPHDLAPIVNLVAKQKLLPEEEKKFREKFVRETPTELTLMQRLRGFDPGTSESLKNKAQLQAILKSFVHHYDAQDHISEEFPDKIEHTIHVPMSEEQNRYYHFAEGRLPIHIRRKIREGLPLTKQESANLNAFATAVRQAAVSHAAMKAGDDRDFTEATPKILKAVDSLQSKMQDDKNFKAVVYSNFVDAGLSEVAKELNKRKVPFDFFTGALSAKQKDDAKEKFNSGKTKVLLLSSSGSEGLNLKGTKLVQILDPHFNESKIDQTIARGIRRGSHAHLPEAERKVVVERYLSTFPPNLFGKQSTMLSIDQYLTQMSKDKELLKNQIKDLIK